MSGHRSSRRAPALLALLALAAVLVALLAWLSWPRGGWAAAPRGGPVAHGARQTPVLGAGAPDARDEVSTLVPGPSGPVSAESHAAAPLEVGDFVLVVDAASGAPVPGAEVRWLSQAPGEVLVGDGFLGELDALMAARAERSIADGQGRAAVEREPGLVLLVTGRGDGTWGFASWGWSWAGELRLELARDASLPVEIVDGAGRPVEGVSVGLAWRNGLARTLRSSARTDADGRAEVPHVLHAPTPYLGNGRWVAVADLLAAEPVEAPVDLAELPAQPVRLVLPATGSFELALVGPTAAPLLERGRVTLRAEPAGAAASLARDQHLRRLLVVEGGGARLEHVGLGLDLHVVASVGELEGETTCAGPRLAGGEARCEVVLGRDQVLLRAQLVGPEAAPLAERPYVAGIERLGARPHIDVREGRTDAQGWIQVALDPRAAAHAPLLSLRVRAPDRAAELEARLELPPLGAGVHDLGALRLAPAPLLVAGRVVDDAGEPLVAASVEARLELELDGGEASWLGATAVRGRTDAEGRFALHGALAPGRTHLWASARGTQGRDVPFARGATDVQVVLTRSGTLRGRVLVEEGADASRWSVGVGEAGELSLWGAQVQDDGRFELALPPGTYDARFAPGPQTEALREVRGVVVPAGGAAEDPRLDPVDLRGLAGALRVVRIHLATASDEPLWGSCTWRAGEGPPSVRTFRSDRIELPFAGEPLEVAIRAAGHREVLLGDVVADRRVELRTGIPVRARIPAGLRLPAAPLELAARLEDVPENPRHRWISEREAGPFVDGEARLVAASPGAKRLVLFVRSRASRSQARVALDAGDGGGSGLRIEVAGGGPEQRVDVPLTQARIDAAAEEARR